MVRVHRIMESPHTFGPGFKPPCTHRISPSSSSPTRNRLTASDRDAILARGLGAVQRRVGAGQQLGGVFRV